MWDQWKEFDCNQLRKNPAGSGGAREAQSQGCERFTGPTACCLQDLFWSNPGIAFLGMPTLQWDFPCWIAFPWSTKMLLLAEVLKPLAEGIAAASRGASRWLCFGGSRGELRAPEVDAGMCPCFKCPAQGLCPRSLQGSRQVSAKAELTLVHVSTAPSAPVTKSPRAPRQWHCCPRAGEMHPHTLCQAGCISPTSVPQTLIICHSPFSLGVYLLHFSLAFLKILHSVEALWVLWLLTQ